MQRAGGDRGATAIGIVSSEDRGASAGLGQAARTGHDSAHGESRAGVGQQRGRAVKRDSAVAGEACCGLQCPIVDSDRTRRVTEVGVAGNAQRPGVDLRTTGIGVGGSQGRGAAACLRQRARTRDLAAERVAVGTVERQHAVVDDIADYAATGAAIAELQRAVADRGVAAIGAVGGQDGGAGAGLFDIARARDHAAIGVAVGAVENERPQIDRIADDRSGRAAATDLERTAVDDGGAGVRVGAGQHPGAAAVLGEDGETRAGVANRAGQCVVARIGTAERDGAVLVVAGQRHRAGVGEDDRARTGGFDEGGAGREREQPIGGVARAGIAQRRIISDHQV